MKDLTDAASPGIFGFRPAMRGARRGDDVSVSSWKTASLVSAKSVDFSLEVKGASCAGSVYAISESSSSSDASDLHEGRNEFVLECKDGEMVFVTAAQGKALKHRCQYFQDLLLIGTPESEEGVVRKPQWPVGIARRIIELLTTGNTWIENDASSFADLVKTAEEVSVEVRVSSLINYHDILGKDDTQKFFKMRDLDKYQFKLQATVTSWQWLELMRRGILLLLKAKVIMVKAAPKIAFEAQTRPCPTRERLTKCDSICSEFCVYADGAINTLLIMLDILAPSENKKEAKGRKEQPEVFKITYMSRMGTFAQEDIDMLWRITAASYLVANAEECKYLATSVTTNKTSGVAASEEEKPTQMVSGIAASDGEKSSDEASIEGGAASPSDTSSEGMDKELVTSKKADGGVVVPQPISSHTKTLSGAIGSKPPVGNGMGPTTVGNKLLAATPEFHYRTITCNSFLVLKHIFASINTKDEDLPACLIVSAPTPDTLGRLINASQKCPDKRCELGIDLEHNTYFAAKSSRELNVMLSYLADYSSSAVVSGDFKLVELDDPLKKK